MKYKSIAVTKRGGPEALKVIENDLREPSPGQVRAKVLAVGVCQDDVAARIGNRPFLPKLPFVPGYDIVGMIDAIGKGVPDVAVGDRVAALTTFGGYAEYIYLRQEQLMPVPAGLDPAQAVPLILNYLTAYQVLHRAGQVKTGDRVLIIGASGGIGTALLQLGKLTDLKMYGTASRSKHWVLNEYGALPIDYHNQDFVDVIRRVEPAGLDVVLNGMDERYFDRGMSVLRRGGIFVHYGAPQSLAGFMVLLAKFARSNLLPSGKIVRGYGTHRVDRRLLRQDWAMLFQLLEQGKIKPIIAGKFPILEAPRANELLESGNVTGNLVLLAPELL